MGKVTGLGGVFFTCADPERMYAWYETHLGMKRQGGEFSFQWVDKDKGTPGKTVWALFDSDTKYFAPSKSPFMLNYRVDDLDGLLERLRAEGVQVDDHCEEHDFGRFAWVMDPEGNRIELWEPPKGQ
jgi:catechol 2,3-dioxygenase-like lactoylglutathione lyase family enzyme